MSANSTARATDDFPKQMKTMEQNTTADDRKAVDEHAHDNEKNIKNQLSSLFSEELGDTWLIWQCRMISGIIRGALYFVSELGPDEEAVSVWPDIGEGQNQLHEVASHAVKKKCGIKRTQQKYGPGKLRTCDLVACPVMINGEPVAVVSIMVSVRSEPQLHALLQLLQWGGLWLETLIHQQSESEREISAFTLSLMSSVMGFPALQPAAMEIVNRLAERFGCERVSIGLRKGASIRLKAFSHVSSFDARTQLVRQIEAAMEEAVDQMRTLLHPGPPAQESAVSCAHKRLSVQHGQGAICTLLLQGQHGIVGAITLERTAKQPFDEETVDWFESIVRLIGPALDIKLREERSFWFKGGDAIYELVSGLFSLSRLKLKFILLSMAALFLLLSVTDGNYQITAPASIEASVRQILVAPQKGYVKQVEVRAGDLVKQGELMILLDDKNLQLEHRKWKSEHNKINKEFQDALAKRDRTQVSVLRAQLEQIDVEINLVEENIERTQIRAPFDGVVLIGDLSQSLGAPVETGEILFEVAPLDNYRVVLEVDEHDVAGLDPGMSGHMIIAALPQTTLSLSLDQPMPVAISGDGRNFFRVEALLDEQTFLLRPGMQGVAKVEIGERKLLWIWTHAVIDRLRLWIWSTGF